MQKKKTGLKNYIKKRPAATCFISGRRWSSAFNKYHQTKILYVILSLSNLRSTSKISTMQNASVFLRSR